MKTILSLLLLSGLVFHTLNLKAQQECVILEGEEIADYLKEESIAAEVRLKVFRCYECWGEFGKSLLFLTENIYQFGDKVEDPLIETIEAHYFLESDEGWELEWDIRDFVIRNDECMEESIWFWTKYMDPKDLDGDGLIDIILVYGSWGSNGYSDNRIKILAFHNGSKRGLRHQNSPMDFGRHTDIDASFYDLPREWLVFIRSQLELMTENNHAIFPAGWQEGWREQSTYWDEGY